jgi:ribonucleotide monophosphatase NagD (HAD superfamily)
MMQAVYLETYGHEMEVNTYGKPTAETFDFATELIHEQARQKELEISQFYMIGDNPKSDISGGNAKGMTTILVKTGVFQTEASTSKNGNDSANPATHVVADFREAIDLIWRLENL